MPSRMKALCPQHEDCQGPKQELERGRAAGRGRDRRPGGKERTKNQQGQKQQSSGQGLQRRGKETSKQRAARRVQSAQKRLRLQQEEKGKGRRSRSSSRKSPRRRGGGSSASNAVAPEARDSRMKAVAGRAEARGRRAKAAVQPFRRSAEPSSATQVRAIWDL